MDITRRQFAILASSASAGALAFAGSTTPRREISPIKLQYANDALKPAISERTIAFHYGKHHAGYARTLNGLISGTEFQNLTLVEIVRKAAMEQQQQIFNNAAQLWNHDFYWQSIIPAGSGKQPSAALKKAIERDFGSLQNCKQALIDAAIRQFGSGWAWLVFENGRLAVESTANAQTPITRRNAKPLLVIDVWEHAYYLDWQNNRAGYVKEVVNDMLNWEAASLIFES
jgi:Fe-Mn family superoxide dismutase